MSRRAGAFAFLVAAYVTLYGFLGVPSEGPGPKPQRIGISFNGSRRYHPPRHGRLGRRSLRGNRRATTRNGAFGKPPSASSVKGLVFHATATGGGGAYTPANGGVQQFVTDVQSGAVLAGSRLEVLTSGPNAYPSPITSLAIGGATAVPLDGFTIDSGMDARGNRSTTPVIQSLTYDSTSGLLTNTVIEGFVINQLTATATTNPISKNWIRRSEFKSTSNVSCIVHNNNTSGCEYFYIEDTLLNNPNQTAPFLDVQGTASSSNGHYWFYNCTVLNSDGGNATTFAQIEVGVNIGPPVLWFSNLDYTSLNTAGDKFINYAANATATNTVADVICTGVYFEGRPITGVTIGSYSSTGTLSAQIRMEAMRINVTSGPFTCVTSSNAVWSSRDNGVYMAGSVKNAAPDTNCVQGTWTTSTTGKAFVNLNIKGGPRGYNATQIAVPASTVAMVNTNCYPCMYEVDAIGAVTAVKFTDTAGGTDSRAVALSLGQSIGPVAPFEAVTFTYTVAPTVKTRGI